MLYLVTAKVPGLPPAATVATLEAGKSTLETLAKWEQDGTVRGAGIFSGRMGMAFIIDAPSNADLHVMVASLPTFTQAEWEVVPMLGIEEDLEMTNGAIEMFRAAESAGS